MDKKNIKYFAISLVLVLFSGFMVFDIFANDNKNVSNSIEIASENSIPVTGSCGGSCGGSGTGCGGSGSGNTTGCTGDHANCPNNK